METPHPPATPEFGSVTRNAAPHVYPSGASFEVRKITVGAYDNNVYALRSGGQVLIVDGADEPDRIAAMAGDDEVVGIVQTHGHFDHVQALASLVERFRCPVRAHPADPMPVTTVPLSHGETIRVGETDVTVLHTPGHTPGSVCFLAGSFLFSGDTLFPGGPGNTRGNPAAFAQIMQQLDEHLFTLPDDTRVCPGHGLDTTIGRERPHVEVWRERGW
ncbi:MAG TPA: MBL fold metallo-hydrolase [Actinomycetota bacterium]|nr:MBL fold metallo-hydrolase [Actinomycetota bacterium]